ncbi:unnamed protein product [Amoebophrya sp. A120]|nr:unnamed protein product [Amoebophrya sp. A120]|eukprot:GSA120T00025004001.1
MQISKKMANNYPTRRGLVSVCALISSFFYFDVSGARLRFASTGLTRKLHAGSDWSTTTSSSETASPEGDEHPQDQTYQHDCSASTRSAVSVSTEPVKLRSRGQHETPGCSSSMQHRSTPSCWRPLFTPVYSGRSRKKRSRSPARIGTSDQQATPPYCSVVTEDEPQTSAGGQHIQIHNVDHLPHDADMGIATPIARPRREGFLGPSGTPDTVLEKELPRTPGDAPPGLAADRGKVPFLHDQVQVEDEQINDAVSSAAQRQEGHVERPPNDDEDAINVEKQQNPQLSHSDLHQAIRSAALDILLERGFGKELKQWELVCKGDAELFRPFRREYEELLFQQWRHLRLVSICSQANRSERNLDTDLFKDATTLAPRGGGGQSRATSSSGSTTYCEQNPNARYAKDLAKALFVDASSLWHGGEQDQSEDEEQENQFYRSLDVLHPEGLPGERTNVGARTWGTTTPSATAGHQQGGARTILAAPEATSVSAPNPPASTGNQLDLVASSASPPAPARNRRSSGSSTAVAKRPPPVLKSVEQLWHQGSSHFRKKLSWKLQEWSYNEQFPHLRAFACCGLGDISNFDSEAKARVRELLEDHDEWIRTLAISQLIHDLHACKSLEEERRLRNAMLTTQLLQEGDKEDQMTHHATSTGAGAGSEVGGSSSACPPAVAAAASGTTRATATSTTTLSEANALASRLGQAMRKEKAEYTRLLMAEALTRVPCEEGKKALVSQLRVDPSMDVKALCRAGLKRMAEQQADVDNAGKSKRVANSSWL